MKTIEAGQTLIARSVCDSDCRFKAVIVSRSGKVAQVHCQGIDRRVKIHCDEAGEFIYAMGRFSMCPVFRAM